MQQINDTTRKWSKPPIKQVYDRTGVRFGRLVALSQAERTKAGKTQWNCICDCGNTKIVATSNLVTGGTTSCGCFAEERHKVSRRTHGMRQTPEYKSWSESRQRCNNPSNSNYKDYGGRGIRVCEKWDQSFESFFADMGAKPSMSHSIDRIDVNGHYEPGNCRWATPQEQSANRRNAVLIQAFGKTMSLAEWSRETGISASEIRRRLSLPHLWSAELALTLKKGERRGAA